MGEEKIDWDDWERNIGWDEEMNIVRDRGKD
jgi:hypothetical protein